MYFSINVKNMKKLVRVLLISILCCVSFYGNAQKNSSSKLHFEYFTIAEGISQNNISCVFQDSKGFLWIGTNAGLNRYDGKNFEVY